MSAVGFDVMPVLRAEPALPLRADPSASAARWSAQRTAFERLVREHESALLAFATRLAGSPADARDLVQDTLERALGRFDAFTPGTNARAWLFTILHRAFIDRCRRRTVEKRADSIDDVQLAAPDPVPPPRWASISAEQLAHAVSQLDEEFRSVYRMHAVESLSYQEIAARLAIPQNTVGTRLARARKKLRAILEAALEGER
jgi:RNA polymerase sigma-70 factor (ECF subfamily)